MRTRVSIFLSAVVLSAVLATPTRAMAGQLVAPVGVVAADDHAKPPQAPGTQKPAPQTTKPKPAPTPKLPIGVRVFGAYETTVMKASQTFKAATGSSSMPGFAVGADILNLWKKVFLRIGMSKASADGTRGFVDETDHFVSTGVPIEIGLRNIELAVGWRNYMKKHPRMALYAAAGMTSASFSQESPDPDAGDNSTASGTGFVGLAGLEFGLKKETPARPAKRQFVLGIEAQFRSITGVLGESGISKDFGEDNLGGFAVRALFGIRFKK